MDGAGYKSPREEPRKVEPKISEKQVPEMTKTSRALPCYLSWKAESGSAFSHTAGLRLDWLLDGGGGVCVWGGEGWVGGLLSKLGRAARKQMRSDTGAKGQNCLTGSERSVQPRGGALLLL